MASVFRQDTSEFIGFMIDLYGPLAPGTKTWPFRAWRHSNGKLRGEPEDRFTAPLPVTVQIPVSNIESPDMHLHVPSDLLDFVLSHEGFKAAQLFVSASAS